MQRIRPRSAWFVAVLSVIASCLTLSVSVGQVRAATIPTNVAGTAGNAQVALTWTAPSDLTFPVTFNGSSYNSVYVGSNTYITYGSGSSQYSSLSASNPAIPGVHMCASDNSYQKVFYKVDTSVSPNRLIIRYEGTASTGGTVGSPNIVYEATFYANQSYFDVLIGTHARCTSGTRLTTNGSTALANVSFAANTNWRVNGATVTQNGQSATWVGATNATMSDATATANDFTKLINTSYDDASVQIPAAPSGYAVQYSSDGGVTWTQATSNSGSTNASYTVTGLTNGTAYVFRVANVVNGVIGTYSSASSSYTPNGTPGTPTGLAGTIGDQQVALTWTAPASNGGSAITDYAVQYSSNSGATWTTFADGTSTSTSATVTGLTNGTSYVFRVAAVNAIGTGSYTAASSGLTPATTPGAPTSVVGTVGNAQVSLTWTAPASTGGSAITDYVIQYSSDSGSTWTTFADGTSATASATVTGLTNGTAYVFRVATTNARGTGSYSSASSSVTPATTPGAPTSVAGTAGNAQVTLTWTAPVSDGGSAITDYVIQYSSNSGVSWTTFADGTSTTASTTVTGLTNGTAYVFRVAASNSRGTGSYSTASSSVTPVTTPGIPTSVSGTVGNAQVALSWTAPSSSGSAITDYVVQYSSDSGSTWTTFADGTSSTASATVTGLTNGTSYVFRVAAVNAVGTGSYSSASSSVTPATTPGAPTSVSGTVGNAQVSLTWTAPGSTGGSAITDYVIQYSSDSGSTWTTFADGTSVTASTTVTGLTNGTTYVFRVAAVNAVGTGSYSSASSSVTPATTPGAPTSVAGTAGNAQVSLTWSAPGSTGGSAITDYVIQYSSNSGVSWTTFADGTSTSTSATVTGLTNSTAYVFRVAATNARGTGSYSSNSSSVTPFGVPGAPTGASATAGARQSTLTWTAPVSNGGSAITGYAVQASSNGGTTFGDQLLTGSTTTSYTYTGLTASVAYVFRVAAITAAGQGNWSSNTSSVTIQDYPGAPTALTGVDGNSQVTLTWTAPSSNGGAAITDYVIQYSTNSGSTWTTFADGTSTTASATVTGLSNGTSYIFRVAATNTWGQGDYSSSTSSQTPFTVPSTPTSVTGAAGSAQVTLTWTASAANGRSVTDYLVQFSTNSGSTWSTFADGTSTATSATVTGLTNGTAYVFRVAATNSAGTGSYSTATSSVTPQSVPSIPLSVTGTGGNGQVSLAWTTPSSNGGRAITDYIIRYSSDSGSTWTTFADGTSSATSTIVTSLTNGTAYVFQVAAVNSVGTGGYSVTSSAVTPFTTPGQPTSASGTAGVSQVELAWTAPASNGGSALTDYAIEYSTNSGSTWVTFVDGTSTATSATVTGLTNGTGYIFRVTARNAAGLGSPSTSTSSVVPRTTPSAAQSVSGTAGNTQVDLTWSAPVSNGGSVITDYVIQYSTDSTNWTVFGDGTSTTTSTTVTGLTNGTAYVFRVAAVNVAGTGNYSVASTSLTPYTTPGTPTSISGTPGNGQVSLTWTAPASNGGSAIIQYKVQVAPEGSDDYATWSASTATESSTASYTVTGLTNGTSYKFRVAASNAAGDGSFSSPSTAVSPYTVPGAPTGVTGTAGEAQVALEWTAPSSTGGNALTDYVIQYSSNSGSSWATFTDGTSTFTSVTVTGLTNGASYVFRIGAVNAAGTGAWSTTSSTLIPRTSPNAPSSAVATAGNEQVTLSWTVPTFDGGTAITDYEVEYSEDATTWTSFADGTSTSRAATITGLTNGTPYYFRVYAVNAVGTSPASAPSSPVTPRTVPTAPTISSITTGNALLTVAFVAGNDGGNPLTTYQYSTDGGATWQTRTVGSTSSPLVISALSSNGTTALSNGTTYSVKIRAVNSAGAGSSSASTSATPTTTPGAPTSLSTSPGSAAITVSWTAPTSNGGASITDYRIEYSTNSGTSWTIFADGTSSATSASITGLTNGTQYIFRVSAINSVGVGTASSWSTSVAPRTAPGIPTSLILTAGAGSIAADWTAPSNGGSTITDYVVEYSSDGSTWVTFNDGLSTTTSATITGLTNGTAYSVRVSAVNVAGTGSAATSDSTVTPRTYPGAPSISSVVADDSQLSIRFTAGSTGGASITAYKYSLNGGSTWVSATGTSSPITVTGLTNGTRYQIALRAVNTVGDGDVSNVIASTPRTVPSAPSITTITAGANQASVAFSAGNNGGSAITDYEYRVMDSSWSAWVSAATTSSPISITNLQNGTTYDVQIRAVNVAGSGSSSTSSTVTPFSTPGAPSITAVSGGAGQATVSFAPGVTGGATITNYEYSTDGGSTWVTRSPASITSPLTITGLSDATTYSVALRAINVAGSGSTSARVSVSTLGSPSQPTIVSTTARNGAVSIAFTPGANGGSPVTNYQYSTDGGTSWVTRSPQSILSPLVISGLTNGSTYSIALRAVNVVGSGAASSTQSVKPHSVPGAPTIDVQTPGDKTLTITFSAGSSGGEEITHYEYSTDRGATWTARTDGETTSSPMTITKLSSDGSTDLENGTEYAVQIRAINMVGTGADSNDMAGTPATAPDAPSGLDTTNGDRYVLVSFTPGSNGGRPISSYEYSTDGGTSWTTAIGLTSPITISTLSIDGSTNLTNGTSYAIKLRAVNSVGAGTPSSAVTTTPCTNPEAPSNVSAVSSSGSISVEFVAGANGGSVITGYEYSTDGGATWRLREPGVSMTSSPITITKLSSDGLTSLTNGTAYDVLIRAVNAAGAGPESPTRTVIPASTPEQPTVSSVAGANGGLSISFTAGNSGGRAVIRNEYSLDGGSTWSVAPTLSSPITINGLTNGTTYAVQVRQVNEMGNGDSSITIAGTPRTIPSSPSVDLISSGNATLSVTFTDGANGGAAISTYEYSTDDGATWRTRRTGSIESPMTITTISADGTTPLENGTFYSVKIRGVNEAGSGVASETVRVSPLTVPTAPSISSVAMRNSFALLTYSVASNGGADVTGYQYSLNAGITWINASSTANPLRISGLRNGMSYSLILRAINRAGSSDSSSTVSLAPIGPPDAPRISRMTPSDQALQVEFTDGDTSGSPITGYEYSLDGGNTWPSAGSATSSPITISGLTNGTIYTVRIRAVNANGSGTSSDPVVSKPYTVPGAPVVTDVSVSGSEATIAYTAPASNGGQSITSYEYSIDGGSSWVSTNSASVYSVQISNLVAGQNYQVGVRAVNSAGAGSATLVNTLSAIVEDAPTPAPVAVTVPRTPVTTIPPVAARPQPTVTTPSTTVPTRPVSTTVPAQVVTTTVPALAVLPGSGGIATQPGDAVVLVDGRVKEVEIVTENGRTRVSMDEGFVLRITPSSDQSTSTLLSDENQLAVVTGSTVSLTGEGFAPNTTVNVWLNSTPILLGTVQVDADGKFDSEFAIPAELAGGHHTLTFVGISAKGSEVRTSVGVVIVKQGDVDTTSDGDVTITEREPSSGPNMSIFIVVGLVVVISTAMIFGRRRRKGQTPRSDSAGQR